MNARPPNSYFLGIDGGGTRCRARIRDSAGNIAGEAEGGLANIYQAFDSALANIIATATEAAGHIPLDQIHAGLGLAGATGPEQCARVERAALPFASVRVDSDGCAACLGAHRGGDGGIVIAGTGSAGFALIRGQRLSLGGHGFVLGDQGSGAVMGRSLMQQALLAHDGIVQASPATRAVMAQFDGTPAKLVEWSRTALSRDYAAFTPQIFAAADEADAVALAIVRQAALGLSGMARQIIRAGAPRVSLIGGLSAAITPWLPAEIAAALSPPLADPLEGALLLARQV